MTKQTESTSAHAGFRIEKIEPGIAVVTFDRPKKMNGLTAATKRDLLEALFHLQFSAGARVIVFMGAGGVFCAGDDVAGYYQEGPSRTNPVGARSDAPDALAQRLRLLSQRLNAAVRELDIITIAAIDGPCIQSGLSLALSCDFRIAAPEAKLGSATLRFGFQPDENGHWLLVRMIGVAKTLDFLLRKRVVSGAEALELGLVHELAPQELLFERAIEMAQEFASGPQTAMRALKRAIHNAADLTFEQAGEDIAYKTAISDQNSDAEEGVAAFREKRPPKFS